MKQFFEQLRVLYCHGLGSSINNRQGTQLKQFFDQYNTNIYFERLLYKNPGSVKKPWNINEWKLDIEQRMGNEKWILMATSGACHAVLNIAKEKPSQVEGLFLFCPGTSLDMNFINTIAPGTLDILIKNKTLVYPPSRTGHPALLTIPNLQEFLNTCVTRAPGLIDISCPVTICHGTEDNIVPYQNSVNLIKRLTSKNAELITIEGGNHYFDIDEQIQKKLAEFLNLVRKKISKL